MGKTFDVVLTLLDGTPYLFVLHQVALVYLLLWEILRGQCSTDDFHDAR